MRRGTPGSFGRRLKALREAAGFTQEELAAIAGLSVQAIGALERGERRRPQMDTVRSLSAALDLNAGAREALIASARAPAHDAAVDELSGVTLPVSLTNLVGRETDLRTLQLWLENGARLVTLVGPGGVGKTRLALEVTRRVADEAVRVVFVELAAIRQPVFVALTVAEALGLSDVAAYDLPRHVRAAVSQEHPTLLVLDNFEQVLDAAPLLAELVTSATALRILITSRAPLRLRGERLYTVEPLGLQMESDTNCPADVARAPAVRLFIERVREAQPEFRVTSTNARTLTAICRRLDALPLALELAAPWMKVLSPEDLLHRLERNPILPDVGSRDLPERQQTMSAAVAWSYHLLSGSEQLAFRRFSVLPGPFSIDGASAVLGCCSSAATDDSKTLRAVSGLIDKSLLVRVQPSVASTRPMYQMLETVRAYAALQLESCSGERDNACDGLVNYCTSEASRAASGLVGPAQAEWLHRVNEDLDSYRSALTWLIQHDREADAIHIVWSLLFFWFIRGRAAEGLRWFEAILSLPSATLLTQSRARTGAAVMCYARGEFDRVRAELREARALAPDVETDIAAIADLMQGHVERLTGNFTAARERFEDSLKTFELLASPWGIGYALSMMGWLALAAGDEDEAQRLVDKAGSALRGSCPWFATLAFYVRAIIAVRHRNPDAAIGFVREGLSLIRRVHDKFAFVHIMVPLAAAAILKGDGAWAARILGGRDAVAERSGARVADGLAHDLLGTIEREGQKSLGANRWAQAYELGRTASIDSLLNDIESASK